MGEAHMKKIVCWLALAALLLLTAAAAGEASLIACEYSVTGGMGNESTLLTLRREKDGGNRLQIASKWMGRWNLPVDAGALNDLAGAMAKLHPENWASLPPSEFIALDAPAERLTITFDDGTEYVLYDDREGAGEAMWMAEKFLWSYTAEDAETFSLEPPAAGTGPVLSAPEVLRVEAGPAGTLTFHGRVPGVCEVSFPADGEDPAGTTWVLEVDNDYNVRLAEEISR